MALIDNSLIQKYQSIVLLLDENSFFMVNSIGIEGIVTGEICFNTGMTGYQEILTDPSYKSQFITLLSL